MFRVCARRLLFLGTVLQSLLSTLLQLDAQIQGLLLGCAVSYLYFVVQVSIFSPRSRWFASLSHDSQQLVRSLRVGKSLVRAARQIGRQRVKWPRHPRMRVRRCVFRWRMILSWWICWLAKLSWGSLRPVGRTPRQQCEDPPSRTCGEVVNLKSELNKRLLAGLGELLRSVTSSLPAPRERVARDQ